tara:strand:+ start:1123 stop:2205 length:1083 start_codon:yes stop_codon:yes gene_type:complete
MNKFIHILSNVTYGGGEQVLYSLCREIPDYNLLFLLRKSNQVPLLTNINNQSPFKSKDVYTIKDYFFTTIYFLILIVKLRLNKYKFDCFVLHGFPCQFMAFLLDLIFPKKKKLIIYHQIKHYHKGRKSIIRYIEVFLLFISSAKIGAPSHRSLNSLKNYIPKFLWKKFSFFLFKNCFKPIIENNKSKILFNEIDLLTSKRPYILTVARFEDFKGHKRLIKFIERNYLLKNKLNFFFIGDGKNFHDCSVYKESNNLSNIFLIGSKPRNSLFNIYKNCLGVFIASYEEAFGVAIVEAQSFKKPIFVFEPSLKINKNIHILDEYKKSYNLEDFKNMTSWNEITKEERSVYSTSDTFNSLEKQI